MKTNQRIGRQNYQITPFTFYVAQDRQKRWSVRIVFDDEPWFVATDLFNGLKTFKSATATMNRIPKEEKRFLKMPTVTGWHKLLVVNGKGLSNIFSRSKKQEVENFKRWCLEDLLPQIRKTYTIPHLSMMNKFIKFIKSFRKQPETVTAKEAQDE